MIDLEAIAERDAVCASHGWHVASLERAVIDRRQLLEHVRELQQQLYDANAFVTIYKEQRDARSDRASELAAQLREVQDHARLRPRSEWTEEEGEVIWYKPLGGRMVCDGIDREPDGIPTHFQRLPPVPKQGGPYGTGCNCTPAQLVNGECVSCTEQG